MKVLTKIIVSVSILILGWAGWGLSTLAGEAPSASDQAGRAGTCGSVYSLLLNTSSPATTEKIECMIVDTGQTSCYDNVGSTITCPQVGDTLYGQDAQYTTAAPNYTNNGDGTVTDHNTDLIWQRQNSDAMVYASADGYCDGLVLGGESDWRVPTIKELYSLIDFNGYTGKGLDTYDSWNPANWKLFIDGSRR